MSGYAMTIGGTAVSSPGQFEVTNPATGRAVGHAPNCTPAQLDVAMTAAVAAGAEWQADDKARRIMLAAAAAAIRAEIDELAPLLTAEQGKPLAEGTRELNGSVVWLEYFSNLDDGPGVIHDDAAAQVEVTRRPVGPVAARAQTVRVGDGLTDGVQLGPVNNKPQLDRVIGLIAGAVSAGARIAVGGERIAGDGYFHQPTIISGAQPGMAVVDDEQFGPALPVIAYDTVDEAVGLANSTRYALGASVWSVDLERAERVAAGLEAGTTWLNTHRTVAGPHQPFGGMRDSGLGRENGPWGFAEFTELHVTYRIKTPLHEESR